MRPNGGGFWILLLPLFAAILLLPPIRAQFGFQDTIFDQAAQGDPLRKVFGIWGRLLNRMAQQGPPSDDELHLKGANEGEEGAVDNSLGEEAMPSGMRRGGGDRTKSMGGPDRIISEGRLNEILPRLFNQPGSTTTTMSTTTTTSTTTSTTELTTTSSATTTMNSVNETTTTTIGENRQQKTKRRKKKQPTVKNATTEGTEATTTSGTISTEMPSTVGSKIPSKMPKNDGKKQIPPMSILKEDEEGHTEKEKTDSTQVIGATIRLRTNVREVEELPVAQSQGITQNGANLSDTMLTRMENETAQLIAEIENVLADAQIGPNGGHWLREEENNSTTAATTIMAKTSTTAMAEIGTTQKGEDEDDEEEWDGEDEEDESGERDESSGEEMQSEEAKNITMKTIKLTSNENETQMEVDKTTIAGRRFKIALPEAEEEEQAAEIAQLQLDSTVATSATSATTIPTTTVNASIQSAQNIFNLNSNANSNANPNFSTMIRPINSVIDGIGPLILPLIGYSRQAFDAYAPYSMQRTEGVSIFRPMDFLGQAASNPRLNAPQSQQQQLVPFQSAGGQPMPPQMPIPLPQPRQILHSAQPTPSKLIPPPNQPQQEIMPDPPSLELLGRIIEQRKQRERERMKLQEVNGSSPPNAEQTYYPPILDNGIADGPIPSRPSLPPATTTTVLPADDPGYDAGRKSVQGTFHEDSGLMLGGQSTAAGGQNAAEQPQKNEPNNPPLGEGGGGGGFGGGRRPNAAPFAFIQ